MYDYCPTPDTGINPGQLKQVLIQLNPDLYVETSPDNNYRIAGVYQKKDGGLGRPAHVMGVPMDWIPVMTELDKHGAIVRRGFRDILDALYWKRLVKDRDYYRRLTRGWRRHPM